MVDLLAPGTAILSLWPQKKSPVTFTGQVGYEFRNGTSMAAPFVSGALAELLSRGMTPDEAKARLLLGTRNTRSESLFKSPITVALPKVLGADKKTATFGNLDLSLALALSPRSMVRPSRKAPIEVSWDGTTDTIPVTLTFENRWSHADAVEINLSGQTFQFQNVEPGARLTAVYLLKPGANPNSTIHLPISIIEDGITHQEEIQLSLFRLISLEHLPSGSIHQTISGTPIQNDQSIRSIVNTQLGMQAQFFLTRPQPGGLEITLLKGTAYSGTLLFEKTSADQLLNIYQLEDGSYASIFAKQESGEPRPTFFITLVDPDFKRTTEIKLGTETTVLSENFRWVKIKNQWSPLWISLGFTPKKDLPAYDPWKPKSTDLKMPRIFFIEGHELRTIRLKDDEIPLQILQDGRIITSKGNEYLQNYQ